MSERKDGFYDAASSFFKRIQKQDLIRVNDKKINTLSQPASKDELKRRSEFSVFRQYLQQKNWGTKHLELFNEYRKMDDNFPIINAALRLYSQEVCLSGDTVIHTPLGEKTILELYNTGKDKTMFYVHTVDLIHKRTQWAMAKYIKYNGVKPVYEVIVERNIDEETALEDKVLIAKFKCTENHKIMMPDHTFKMLSELSPGDRIFSFYKYTDPSCKCKEDKFQSSKILSIKLIGEEDVYDLVNVEPFSHFSIKLTDSMYVQVHNCTKDDSGNVIKIHSSDKDIKQALEELFFKNLKINSQAYLLVKEMLKFGNLYCFLNVRKGEGVTDLIQLPPEALRIELMPNAEDLDDFKYTWYGQSGGGMQFEPHELVHFRNIEDIEHQPYGTSILRSVVDTWRRIILMREALIIYRITRAPQRYLFKIDTTGMDPDAALLFAEQVKKDLYKKPLVNAFTGEIDFKYNPLPVSKNTLIPLLDGRTITISELAKEYEEGKENFVYSIKDTTNEIVAGKVKWCGKNYTANKLIRVWLDDNSFIDAAPEHPFILRNGSIKNADQLNVEDSLMPFYTDLHGIANGNKKSSKYERVYNPATNKFEFTHKLVAKEVNKTKNEYNTIHHKDFNKYNNSPNNLQWTEFHEHKKMHSELTKANWSKPGYKENISKKVSKTLLRKYKNGELNHVKEICSDNAKKMWLAENFRKQKSIDTSKQFKDFFKSEKGQIRKNSLSEQTKLFNKNKWSKNNYDNQIKSMSKICDEFTWLQIESFIEENENCQINDVLNFINKELVNHLNSINKRDCSGITKNWLDKQIIKFGYDSFTKLKHSFGYKIYKNHKVSKIEILENVSEDVYCMTVVGENESDDRHNFAISTLNRNGIFVKNSIEENIYMPTFEGDVGGIDVLQGASNLGDVEDYKIIKDDLFAGLLIPKSYLTFEEDLCLRGNTEILTNNGLITIKELSDNWINGQKTFVLSCNKYGYITPGKVLWCKETKETNVLYKIFINETKYEETTENHPFLMDDLTYKSASELNIGDKLRGMYEKEYFVTDIKIEVLDTPEKVYDLEVEEYHNFALSSGVFVHNSNKAALAQEDMRFAGAIKQYQGNFIEALLHIAIVHLTSKGFSVEDLSKFELEMNTNSKLVKKLENETLQQKVDLAKSILDTSNGELTLMSFTQVLKDVMNFSDEEISTAFENQLLEKKISWRLSKLKENGFYEEPKEEKKNAMMQRLGDDDVFSKLKFEGKEKINDVEKILTEKVKKEVSHLIKPVKSKPSKRQIKKLIDLNPSLTEIENVKKDLGLMND